MEPLPDALSSELRATLLYLGFYESPLDPGPSADAGDGTASPATGGQISLLTPRRGRTVSGGQSNWRRDRGVSGLSGSVAASAGLDRWSIMKIKPWNPHPQCPENIDARWIVGLPPLGDEAGEVDNLRKEALRSGDVVAPGGGGFGGGGRLTPNAEQRRDLGMINSDVSVEEDRNPALIDVDVDCRFMESSFDVSHPAGTRATPPGLDTTWLHSALSQSCLVVNRIDDDRVRETAWLPSSREAELTRLLWKFAVQHAMLEAANERMIAVVQYCRQVADVETRLLESNASHLDGLGQRRLAVEASARAEEKKRRVDAVNQLLGRGKEAAAVRTSRRTPLKTKESKVVENMAPRRVETAATMRQLATNGAATGKATLLEASSKSATARQETQPHGGGAKKHATFDTDKGMSPRRDFAPVVENNGTENTDEGSNVKIGGDSSKSTTATPASGGLAAACGNSILADPSLAYAIQQAGLVLGPGGMPAAGGSGDDGNVAAKKTRSGGSLGGGAVAEGASGGGGNTSTTSLQLPANSSPSALLLQLGAVSSSRTPSPMLADAASSKERDGHGENPAPLSLSFFSHFDSGVGAADIRSISAEENIWSARTGGIIAARHTVVAHTGVRVAVERVRSQVQALKQLHSALEHERRHLVDVTERATQQLPVLAAVETEINHKKNQLRPSDGPSIVAGSVQCQGLQPLLHRLAANPNEWVRSDNPYEGRVKLIALLRRKLAAGDVKYLKELLRDSEKKQRTTKESGKHQNYR